MTRTITLSDEHWQTISDALSDFCDEGPPDSPWKSSGLSAAQEALDAALAQPEWPVQDDKTRPFLYSPVTIAECAGGPCQQGPEYCDCGLLTIACESITTATPTGSPLGLASSQFTYP
jgi:hypothetical protein